MNEDSYRIIDEPALMNNKNNMQGNCEELMNNLHFYRGYVIIDKELSNYLLFINKENGILF